MRVVDIEKGVPRKRKAAFVIFYCLNRKPWESYREADEERKALTIPTCLMINRWDGTIGFIGGRIEKGEAFEEAVKREVFEEIGHELSLKPEPIVAHDIGPITTHAFAVEVSSEEILHIQRDASLSEDFGSEVTGVFLPHLIDYDSTTKSRKGGIIELYRSSMAPSVREELTHFLLKRKVFSKSQLEDICKKAGFDLPTLLS